MAESITELRVANPPVELNLLACGDPQQPCLVMVHGLRDTAWALAPIAQALAAGSATHPGYYCLLYTFCALLTAPVWHRLALRSTYICYMVYAAVCELST